MSEKKYCLQCGAELFLDAVPINPDLSTSQSVAACHACHSRIYDVPGNKILELTAQRDELLAALKALFGWQKAEVEHFGATCPDDFIIEMVEKALKNA